MAETIGGNIMSVENDALGFICDNLKETLVNNKQIFAKWKLGIPMGSFATKLMELWEHADPENQYRLAIAYPQIAEAIIQWQAFPKEKQRTKYLKNLLNLKD